MPSWNELVNEIDKQPSEFLRTKLQEALQNISKKRDDRNVIFYASAFLQKPELQSQTSIMPEDINGFMTTIYQMDRSKGLVLLLHTPGGVTTAAETIVDYLHKMFDYIEVVIPTYAMSAGTMISLSSNLILMGKQSQLGPIDPQMPIAGRYVSAQSIVDQFEKAKEEISNNPTLANVWYPVLQTIGPALLQEAQNALDYSEKTVAEWLESRMLASEADKNHKAKEIARFFRDASIHLSHGSRINKDKAAEIGVKVESLEADQELQDYVLTAYHLMTIAFEKTPATKIIESNIDRRWVKNYIQDKIGLR